MRNLEYCMLHDARPIGKTVGVFADKEICETVIDGFGQLYDYVGVASRKSDGNLDAEALKPGEFILSPGLVYRIVRKPTSGWARMVA